MTDPRSRAQRDRFRVAVLAAHGPVCRMPVCVMPTRAIDLRLRWPHRGCYVADHVVELAEWMRRGGDPFDPRNGRPAHNACNSSAGAAYGNRKRSQRTCRRCGRPIPETRLRYGARFCSRACQRVVRAGHVDPPPPPGWERRTELTW